LKKPNKEKEVSEIEVECKINEVLLEVEVSVRVLIGEDKKFSIILKRKANDKIK
jgi:hypothetical protein